MKLLVILTNGFEEIEAIGTIAILRRGNVDLDIYALDNLESTGRYGVTVSNLKDFNSINIDDYDALFLPGGPGYVNLMNNEKVIGIIKKFNNEHKIIATICAAPTILGHLGLLKNKNYTCFTSMNEDFGGHFIDTYVVKDDNLITGKSAAATIDFAFKILEALKGKDFSESIKNQIYYYNK